MLTTHNSQLATQAIDVLFHPTSRTLAGACPLQPPTEAQLDQAGISQVLVSQCKRWSCERQWMCVDTRLYDVLCYTESSPRFHGLAGYNPFDIPESLREIELAVTTYGFRGLYLHLAGFNLSLTDPRLYPLFAKAAELAVPVLIQLPVSRDLRPALDCLAVDFPGLALVLALPRPRMDNLTAIANEYDSVFFALDPAALAPLSEECGAGALARDSADQQDERNSISFWGIFQERCMWGSNGMAWPDALRAADSLVAPPLSRPGLAGQGGDFPNIKPNFLRHNAERVFALNRALTSRSPRSVLTEPLAAER